VSKKTKAAALATVTPKHREVPVDKKIVSDYGQHLHPTFSFNRIDRTSVADSLEFGWHLLDATSSQKLLDFIVEVSRSPWTAVRSWTGPKHRLHHDQSASDIAWPAQQRLAQFFYEWGSDLFRFHVDNLERLWGFEIEGVFYVVWWDPDHKVYELSD
jgi:hypothetical protein